MTSKNRPVFREEIRRKNSMHTARYAINLESFFYSTWYSYPCGRYGRVHSRLATKGFYFYVPSFYRMPARFGALVSACMFVFMALWSSVGADCCDSVDCPCPTTGGCATNMTVTVEAGLGTGCNWFGCSCDECPLRCPPIPADLSWGMDPPFYGPCCALF
jgi:hypothetical protein